MNVKVQSLDSLKKKERCYNRISQSPNQFMQMIIILLLYSVNKYHMYFFEFSSFDQISLIQLSDDIRICM